MSRAQLTSTVEQNSAGAAAPVVAGKNLIANGAFDIWQRGTSFSPGTNATVYTADRWAAFRNSSASYTVSQISAGLAGFTYAARVQRTASTTTTDPIYLGKSFETIADVTKWQGKTLTLSFYARAGSNFSGSSNFLVSYFSSGSGTDTPFTTEPGSSTSFQQNNILTTSWQRFSQTVTVPSGSTAARMFFDYNPTGTAGANDYFDVTGVQLEIGSVATPFATAAGTLQGELALCQRYYWAVATGTVQPILNMAAQTTTSAEGIIQYPVTMRTTPSLAVSNTAGSFALKVAGGAPQFPTFTIDIWNNNCASMVATLATSTTVGAGGIAYTTSLSASTFVAFSSEL